MKTLISIIGKHLFFLINHNNSRYSTLVYMLTKITTKIVSISLYYSTYKTSVFPLIPERNRSLSRWSGSPALTPASGSCMLSKLPEFLYRWKQWGGRRISADSAIVFWHEDTGGITLCPIHRINRDKSTMLHIKK